RTPGIGPKVAGRMLLELGGKLPAPVTAGGSGTAAGGTSAAAPSADAHVVEALVGLGWPEKAATGAVEAVAAQHADDAAGTEPAALLREALRHLGGSR